MKNIIENLISRDFHIIATLPIGDSWQDNSKFLSKIDEADLVLINAEGTIHHNSQYGLNLLKVIDILDDKPSVLMNMTYQDNSLEYIELIKRFTKVYVRESMSQKELAHYGITSTVVPDMTFYSRYDCQIVRGGNMCITDSHDINKSKRLYELSKKMGYIFLPVLSSYHKYYNLKGYSKKVKYGFFEKYGKFLDKFLNLKYGYKRYSYVMPEEIYIDTLQKAKCIISARFHVICFALQTKTPFIAIDSNTHKIESMLKDVGLKDRIVDFNSDILTNNRDCNFNKDELIKVDNYLDLAKVKISKMFDEISKLEVRTNIDEQTI
jgi:polysaccharide pyruvyl transferase WcaK-like protein